MPSSAVCPSLSLCPYPFPLLRSIIPSLIPYYSMTVFLILTLLQYYSMIPYYSMTVFLVLTLLQYYSLIPYYSAKTLICNFHQHLCDMITDPNLSKKHLIYYYKQFAVAPLRGC